MPGLYVIDSVVRQSRHQFGSEKDVFAPRFSKNIVSTFQNLCKCSSDDKVCVFVCACVCASEDVWFVCACAPLKIVCVCVCVCFFLPRCVCVQVVHCR